jgi:SSS family transporter
VNGQILLILGLYFAVQFFIAIFASRFIKNEADYLLAGRHLGLVLASFSIFATWFGAETVVASSGAVAAEGMSGGRAEPFGYAICLILFGLLIAFRLRAKEYVTVSDFYRERYSKITEKVSVLLMIPTSLIWAAAQVLAFGTVLSSLIGLPMTESIAIGTAIVVLYTTVGGFLGDVITDLLQGGLVIIGLLMTAVFITVQIGGLDAALEFITPERLSIVAKDTSLLLQADEWAIAILGSLVAQEAISRILATKSPQVGRSSCFVAAIMYFTVGLIPAYIGLTAAHLVDVGDNSDLFLPELAKTVLPPFIYVMFLGALISAILSTINSTLLSISALVGHNIILPLRPGMSEKGKVLLQRLIVVLAGLATFGIAAAGENIYSLIEMSSSFGSAGLLVCLLFGLWTGFGGKWAALATLAAGAVSAYVFQYVLEWDAGYLASIGVSIIVYGAVSVFDRAAKGVSYA